MKKQNNIIIDGTSIGNSQKCYVIAEIGINHNGKLDIAKKLIDVAVEAGANAIKFQKRNLKDLYREDALNDPNIESQGFEILLQVLKEVEFNEKEYRQIVDYCNKKKITFLCTPWDKQSVDFLEKFNVSAYKVASADMTNFPLIRYIAKTGKPIIISTGMSTMDEIKNTVDFLKKENSSFILLHCNSTYPAPVEQLNLELIPTLKEKFKVPVGYSGHEQNIIPTLTATNMGACVVERHITLDKKMEGIDQSVSLNPDEFSKLIKYIRESEKAKGISHKKITRGEILQREILSKSIICKKDINEGEVFLEDNIEVKGPAKGISPQHYFEILGKKTHRKLKKGQYIQSDDL
jgi:N-acetylneuraminate synthase